MAWQLDKSHAHINFTVRHLMVTNVRGQFSDFDVNVDFNDQDLAKSSVEATIKAASIDTRFADRDTHLRSADFLDVENYPELTFKSKNIALNGRNNARIVGDLTIRGVTKEVVLDVEYTGIIKNPWGIQAAGFNAHTTIKRQDWGLVWNVALEAGGVLVGDDVKIDIELELVKVPEAATVGQDQQKA
jgi:polyisoprenoid-binding protein YceI